MKHTGAMATQVEPKGSRGGAEAHGIGGIESGEGLWEERDNYLEAWAARGGALLS